MKGAAVIQHLSVVNTSRRDIVVSRRGKKTWPNVKNCGCPAGSKKNVCLSGSGNAVSSKLTVNTNHVLCACVRVRMCVCLVTLLCQCALNGYHVQVPTFFSNWMKDGRDCEKFSVTFVKMLGFFLPLAGLKHWQNPEMQFPRQRWPQRPAGRKWRILPATLHFSVGPSACDRGE